MSKVPEESINISPAFQKRMIQLISEEETESVIAATLNLPHASDQSQYHFQDYQLWDHTEYEIHR